MSSSIESFFEPKTAAVIGASNHKGTIGYTVFYNLRHANIRKTFPVNPNHSMIQGVKSYRTVSAIEEKLDLAVIAVPADFVPKTLEECMKKKVKAVIIISAGFSEVGERKNTHKIEALIKKYPKTRVMGPNCVGVMNNYNKVDTTFFERKRMQPPKKGSVSFISQSGALGSMILDWAATQEFGISKFISYGNAMDVDEADLLEYLGNDPQTKVITIYLEGAKKGRKFYSIAKKVSKRKPIIALKGGKHEETSRAAASHTGSLAGAAQVYDAVFSQAGIMQADDLLDLFSLAKIMDEEPLAKGNRVQIITNGGGFGIVAADQLIANGLKMTKLTKKTRQNLKKQMPQAIISNPLDILGDADAHRYKVAVMAALRDRNVDIIVVLALFTLPTLNAKNISSLRRPSNIRKPLIVISVGSKYTQEYLGKIERAGFTTFHYPSVAAKAIKQLTEYSKFRGVARA